MSDTHKITGFLILKHDEQTFDSGFRKREFVISDGHDQYPQEIKFELIKDKCAILDEIPLKSEIEVSFNIRGNEYKGRHYVNLQAWRIDVLQEGKEAKVETPEPGNDEEEDELDDVPF